MKAIVNLNAPNWHYFENRTAWIAYFYASWDGYCILNAPEKFPCYAGYAGSNPDEATVFFVFLYDVEPINVELGENETDKTVRIGGLNFTIDRAQYNSILRMAKQRDLIPAIKAIRTITGCGLKEGKDFIDSLI